MNTLEKREFALDKNLLWTVIQNQAGSLSKGLLELVMNSVDAGASRVDLTLDARTFEVSDDGKGFVDRSEIDRFFETFGTPHKEGDATFGQFRMGRGQIMSFAQTFWRSGLFAMDVDIQHRGMEYDLHTLTERAPGCAIKGTLYEALKPSEFLRECQELETLCKYCPIPVLLNGKRINVDLAAEKWTHQDDDAYYLIRPGARYLEAFNLGVSVRAYPSGHFGVGGVVVSKRQLKVNFARNDILLSKCEVWKRISRTLREIAQKENDNPKKVKNEAWREAQARRIASGDVESAAQWLHLLRREKVLTDVRGRHLSFGDLMDAGRRGVVISEARKANDPVADRVHSLELALVLSHRTADRFHVRDFPSLLDMIEQSVLRAYPYLEGEDIRSAPYAATDEETLLLYTQRIRDQVASIDKVGATIRQDSRLLESKDISKDEAMMLQAVDRAQNAIYFAVMANQDPNAQAWTPRRLRVGVSETNLAWTDGVSYIALERKLLKVEGYKGGPLKAFTKVAHILLHEYLHHDDDASGHVHDAEFFERFERIAIDSEAISRFLEHAIDAWLAAKRKQSNKQTLGVRKALDQMEAVATFAQAA